MTSTSKGALLRLSGGTGYGTHLRLESLDTVEAIRRPDSLH